MVGETEVFHARREAGMQHTHAERELVIGGDEGPWREADGPVSDTPSQ